MKPYIKSKLLVIALASLAREGECGSFFGLCPKNEPPILLLRERSEHKVPFNAYFEFMYGFKILCKENFKAVYYCRTV
ncbi:MAG: hypothetical protein U5L45_13760 [Saprospiraceae bacterium]|nr:hypothetical protein [Saprospiraceae bacterium]